MEMAGYEDLRREQAEKRARGELMGIGVSFFTEGVGAGPRKHMDILGLAMNDGADLRVHRPARPWSASARRRRGRATRRRSRRSSPRSSGSPGGRRGSPRRHGQVALRARHLREPLDPGVRRRGRGRLRKVRDKARQIAGTMLEASPDDLAWEKGRWYVKGDPEKGAPIEEIAARAYSGEELPEGMEGGLDAQVIYDPPNLTYPYGAYLAVVDIDPDAAHVWVRRFIAVTTAACG